MRNQRKSKSLTDLQYLNKFCGEVKQFKTDDDVRMMTIITKENMMGRRFTKLTERMGYELYTAIARGYGGGLFMAFYRRRDVKKVDKGDYNTWRMFPPSNLSRSSK